MRSNGFTILEMIIVLVIVMIISVAGIVSIMKSQEDALRKDAIATLMLLRAAQRAYYLDNGNYLISGNNFNEISNSALNYYFKLSLCRSGCKVYYRCRGSCCDAYINAGGGIYYRIDITNDEPVPGTCN